MLSCSWQVSRKICRRRSYWHCRHAALPNQIPGDPWPRHPPRPVLTAALRFATVFARASPSRLSATTLSERLQARGGLATSAGTCPSVRMTYNDNNRILPMSVPRFPSPPLLPAARLR